MSQEFSENKNKARDQSFGGKFSRFIKTVDKFGHPITMTYDNNQTYKSVFGGAMTILSVMGIISYLGVNIYTALTKS